MSRLLNRQIHLSVGTTGIASSLPDDEGFHPTLRVVFKVERSTQQEPNKAEIEVWNLREETRKSLDSVKVPVLLDVGYGTELFRLFGGNLSYAASVRQGVDWVTKLQLQDGGAKYRSARVNLSLAAGTTLGAAVQSVAEAFGLPIGNLNAHLKNIRGGPDVFTKGVVLSGRVSTELDKLLKTLGYGWSIQDGQLQVLASNETLPALAVKLTSTSGLVGSPERSDKGFVKVRALLQPDLFPGAAVVIESEVVSGTFRIQKGSYSGDTAGPEWYADLEVVPV